MPRPAQNRRTKSWSRSAASPRSWWLKWAAATDTPQLFFIRCSTERVCPTRLNSQQHRPPCLFPRTAAPPLCRVKRRLRSSSPTTRPRQAALLRRYNGTNLYISHKPRPSERGLFFICWLHNSSVGCITPPSANQNPIMPKAMMKTINVRRNIRESIFSC